MASFQKPTDKIINTKDQSLVSHAKNLRHIITKARTDNQSARDSGQLPHAFLGLREQVNAIADEIRDIIKRLQLDINVVIRHYDLTSEERVGMYIVIEPDDEKRNPNADSDGWIEVWPVDIDPISADCFHGLDIKLGRDDIGTEHRINIQCDAFGSEFAVMVARELMPGYSFDDMS